MKNTIVIDATKNCICDLVSTIDNGENRFFIEIRADTSLNPRLEIESEQIQITGSPFVCEIGTAYYVGTGSLQFRIVDDNHAGDYFQITKIAKVDGNLFLSQKSNFNYELIQVIVENKTGVPIATAVSLGVVKGGANVGIKSDGTHKMALSWNGSEIIAGIDDDAAVKTLVSKDRLKVLWTGGHYMTADQTAILSEKISDQPNGICLVWCHYDPSTNKVSYSDTHTQFIPKWCTSGKSMAHCLIDPYRKVNKYFYVDNDKIKGNNVNAQQGTENGHAYDNRYQVLVAVVGV